MCCLNKWSVYVVSFIVFKRFRLSLSSFFGGFWFVLDVLLIFALAFFVIVCFVFVHNFFFWDSAEIVVATTHVVQDGHHDVSFGLVLAFMVC